MKNETITTYTEITVEQAGELLRDNGWSKPVEGVAFRDYKGWVGGELVGIIVDDLYPFKGRDRWLHCATVTELDPCQAPDGCPELEPWMAYVGKNPMDDAPDSGSHCNKFLRPSVLTKCWNSGNGNCDYHYAIDVRTAWAQEHFSEHCRIRNYQEPDPFRQFIKDEDLEWQGSAEYSLAKRAYNLGQQNPQPTK